MVLVDIPADLLQQLVCSKCDMLLRKGPVFQQHDGEAVCGLCQERDDAQPASRCRLYELTAQLLRFPCRNQEDGCPTTVPFVDADSTEFTHEDACEYRQYVCPVLGSNMCDWAGYREQMHQHCQQAHPDLLLPNPVDITPDIRKSHTSNYIIPAFRVLFLLHTKVCVRTAHLHYAVRLLNDPRQACNYEFALIIRRGEQVFRWTKEVLQQELLVLQEHSALNISTNSLLNMLGGWKNASLTVEVTMRNQVGFKSEQSSTWSLSEPNHPIKLSVPKPEPRIKLSPVKAVQPFKGIWAEPEQEREQCGGCRAHTPRLYKNARGWLCAKCAPAKEMCRKCDFQDIVKKRVKHSKWFCQQRTRCPLVPCNAVLQPNTLYEHYTICRWLEVLPAGSKSLIRCNEDWKWFLVGTSVGRVVCMCNYTGSEFWFTVRTPIPSEQLHLYRCKVRLECAGDVRTLELAVWYDKEWDWAVDYRYDDFFSDEVHARVEVERRDNSWDVKLW